MASVKNQSTHVVSIGGKTIIAPLAIVHDVDLKTRGVAELVKRGILVEVGDQPAEAENDDAPSTVADLKAALTERGIDFPENAKKADLQALYDAGK